MRIQLSDHFSYGKLLRFSLPSMAMMAFTSIYGVVDGLFVSNFVGKEPFAAINLIMPILMIAASFGFMMGAGGTAIVAKTLGEGDKRRANEYFSFIVYITIAAGVVIATIGILFMPQLASLLGAKGETLEYVISYGRIVLKALPFYMMTNLFQSLFIAAEKPKLGLYVNVFAGISNMVLDALFVVVLDLGLEGAAYATAITQFIGGALPIVYFARKNDSLLRLTRARFYGKVLLKSMTNGSSELMSNISMSVVTVFYNLQLMKYAGDDGVAAYGVIMYVSFIFIAIFIGYAIGTAPIISYHYGANNEHELKSILRKSSVITLTLGASMLITGAMFAGPLSAIFVSYDKALLEMTTSGLFIFSFSFIFSGYSIFISSFFTALNNGLVSAALSFLRTLVFQLGGILILPIFLGLDGIWYSMLIAEVLAMATTVILLFANNKKYKYM